MQNLKKKIGSRKLPHKHQSSMIPHDKNWSSTSIGSNLRGFNLQVPIRIHYFNTQKFKVKIESGRKKNELKKGTIITTPSIGENW